MHNVYFIFDQSATARGWVGLVIDSNTHLVITRTPTVYVSAALAQTAARWMWQRRLTGVAA